MDIETGDLHRTVEHGNIALELHLREGQAGGVHHNGKVEAGQQYEAADRSTHISNSVSSVYYLREANVRTRESNLGKEKRKMWTSKMSGWRVVVTVIRSHSDTQRNIFAGP